MLMEKHRGQYDPRGVELIRAFGDILKIAKVSQDLSRGGLTYTTPPPTIDIPLFQFVPARVTKKKDNASMREEKAARQRRRRAPTKTDAERPIFLFNPPTSKINPLEQP
jgi:hypothetical protein